MCENSEPNCKPPGVNECSPHLHAVLDLSSVVSDDEGRLHDGRKLDVAVSLVLSLEFVQQCLVGGLREAVIDRKKNNNILSWGQLFLEKDNAHRKTTHTQNAALSTGIEKIMGISCLWMIMYLSECNYINLWFASQLVQSNVLQQNLHQHSLTITIVWAENF